MATKTPQVATNDIGHGKDIELIFLGTGTSSSLPHIECLTAQPEEEQCQTCLSTLHPWGKKNIRRNTSAVLRVNNRYGEKTTIVIDVGKNFQAAALEWFPKYGLRRIDAVLITHAHADAMNGLDDLRGWTLGGAIQSHIDVYLSQTTFAEVQRSFPYLVCKEFASGGGDVPEFKWHLIDDKIPFELDDTGIRVTPFAVHHGRHFSELPLPTVHLPTPSHTAPSTPISGRSTPQSPSAPLAPELLNHIDSTPTIRPYICFGYQIEDAVIYISDTSHIPKDTWSLLRRDPSKRIPVFVIDCLRPWPHTSHFGLKDSMAAVRKMGGQRSYMTGFGHEVTHNEYLAILKSAESSSHADTLAAVSENIRLGLELIGKGDPIWVRPAFDGLRVSITSDGAVTDDSY